MGELEEDLSREKEKNLHLTQQLSKLKKEMVGMRRTITNYRKAVTEMQKDFFTGGAKGGPPSSLTMTSIGKTSGIMKREVSHAEDVLAYPQHNDDVLSSTSGIRDKDFKDSTNKVQQYLETNHSRVHKQSSQQMRSGVNLTTTNAPGRAIKVNYNSACDLERFEKFKSVIQTLSEVRKLARLFAITIKEIPNIVPTSSVSIFVITPNMILNRQLVDFKLILQKSVLDGKFIDVVGPSDTTMADP